MRKSEWKTVWKVNKCDSNAKEYYNSFAKENVIVGMGNYLLKKDDNTCTCDVAVAGICNAINTSIIVYQARADGTFMEIHHSPGHPSTASKHKIHLVRVG